MIPFCAYYLTGSSGQKLAVRDNEGPPNPGTSPERAK
jgi:hypothetical protein